MTPSKYILMVSFSNSSKINSDGIHSHTQQKSSHQLPPGYITRCLNYESTSFIRIVLPDHSLNCMRRNSAHFSASDAHSDSPSAYQYTDVSPSPAIRLCRWLDCSAGTISSILQHPDARAGNHPYRRYLRQVRSVLAGVVAMSTLCRLPPGRWNLENAF